MPPNWLGLAILGSSIAVGFPLIVAAAFILHQRRTREIRLRDYPAWEGWLGAHYPKASKEEAAVIRRVVGTFAHLARVEPTQLHPDDRIEGHVLQPTWQASLDPESEYGDLYDELGEMLRSTDLAEWEIMSGDAWETVGDAIDFMLKRLCPLQDESSAKLLK